MAASRPPLRRMQQIDALLRERRYPGPNVLAARLEVTRRTVLRDLAYLREQCGAPIDFDRAQARLLLHRRPLPPPRHPALRRRIAGGAGGGKSACTPTAAPPSRPHCAPLSTKSCAPSPTRIISHAGIYTSAFSFDLGPLRAVPERLFTLFAAAITARRRVRIRYHTQSRDETNTRTLDPYRLHNDRGDWYLIAYCHLRHAVRDFLLYRIEDATPLDEHLPPRATISTWTPTSSKASAS